MMWLRLIGSLKLQVSFAKQPYERDNILQKRPVILRSLLIVAAPYDVTHTGWRTPIRCLITVSRFPQKSSIYLMALLWKETCNLWHLLPLCHPVQLYVWVGHTRWQRPIGCLQLQVIFRKRATNYRALLRKMTCKDKASYGSSPPCIMSHIESYVSYNVSPIMCVL